MKKNARQEHETYLLAQWPRAGASRRRELLNYHQRQVAYLQHERLIHLIVTLFVSLVLLMIFFMILIGPMSCLLAVLFIIFISLTLAYLRHYYILENTCQRWQVIALDYERQLLKASGK